MLSCFEKRDMDTVSGEVGRMPFVAIVRKVSGCPSEALYCEWQCIWAQPTLTLQKRRLASFFNRQGAISFSSPVAREVRSKLQDVRTYGRDAVGQFTK